jgi:hypothetical protein
MVKPKAAIKTRSCGTVIAVTRTLLDVHLIKLTFDCNEIAKT